MPAPVTKLYAETQRCKALWADAADPVLSAQYLAQGRLAGDAMAARRSDNLDGVLLKLAELEEWIQEDVTISARVLLQSAIADIEAIRDGDAEPAPADPSPPRRPGPMAEASGLEPPGPSIRVTRNVVRSVTPEPSPQTERPRIPRVALTPAAVKVDRRTRPVQIGEVIYPSVALACQSLGLTPYQVQRMSEAN